MTDMPYDCHRIEIFMKSSVVYGFLGLRHSWNLGFEAEKQ